MKTKRDPDLMHAKAQTDERARREEEGLLERRDNEL